MDKLLPFMVLLTALLIVGSPAQAQGAANDRTAAPDNSSASRDQYKRTPAGEPGEPMGAGHAADDAARQADEESRSDAATYATALDAARSTSAEGRTEITSDQAAAATPASDDSSASGTDKRMSVSNTGATSSEQYGQPPNQNGRGPTTQAATDAAEEAVSSAQESSDEDAAAYAAALDAARDTGATEAAASIAATKAVADIDDEGADTDSSKDKGKDSPDIEMLPATGGLSSLVPAASILAIAGILLALGLYRR